MWKVLGHETKLCDGLRRREALSAGALALFGANLPALLRAENRAAAEKQPRERQARARSVILINLFGGPPHMDLFDLKPQAPSAIRGEFQPISTPIPGVQVCEHLPQIARLMDKATLIRTYAHKYNSHNPYNVLTGFDGGSDRDNYFAKRTDHPSIGSVCQYAGLGSTLVPPYVTMPAFPGYSQSLRRAGPYGGYLGGRFDPLMTTCLPQFSRESKSFYDPVIPYGSPIPPMQSSVPELSLDRLHRRHSLMNQFDAHVAQLERSPATDRLDDSLQQAFALLSSTRTRAAFDIDAESPGVRDRYGRNLWGSCALMARRLVEAGTTFVTIHWESDHGGHWDLHENNFGMLKQHLPQLDQLTSALITDLEGRDLLDQTLVIVMGEMGRTPRINGNAGRDHWPQCGFSLLFGGGVKRGAVLGTTDKIAALPIDRPVSTGDLAATIYFLLGVDPELMVTDLQGRPVGISHGGKPLHEIIGS